MRRWIAPLCTIAALTGCEAVDLHPAALAEGQLLSERERTFAPDGLFNELFASQFGGVFEEAFVRHSGQLALVRTATVFTGEGWGHKDTGVTIHGHLDFEVTEVMSTNSDKPIPDRDRDFALGVLSQACLPSDERDEFLANIDSAEVSPELFSAEPGGYYRFPVACELRRSLRRPMR